MKKLLFAPLLLLMLTACGSYKEINELTIVSAGALDINEFDKFDLTCELLKVNSEEKTPKSSLLTMTGDSISEVFSDVDTSSNFTPYWSHSQVFGVGERLAKTGMLPLANYIASNPEIRLSTRLFVMKDKNSMIAENSMSGDIVGFDIYELMNSSLDSGLSVDMPLYRVINTLNSTNIDLILPAIGVSENNLPSLEGSAIFKDDKLAGYLNADQTRTFNLLTNSLSNVTYALSDNEAYKLSKTRCKISVQQTGDTITFPISLDIEAEPIYAYSSKKNLADRINNDINNLFLTLNHDMNCDPIGFKRQIYRYAPDYYKDNLSNIEQVYRNSNIQLKLSINIVDKSLVKPSGGD